MGNEDIENLRGIVKSYVRPDEDVELAYLHARTLYSRYSKISRKEANVSGVKINPLESTINELLFDFNSGVFKKR